MPRPGKWWCSIRSAGRIVEHTSKRRGGKRRSETPCFVRFKSTRSIFTRERISSNHFNGSFINGKCSGEYAGSTYSGFLPGPRGTSTEQSVRGKRHGFSFEQR